jgi:hypothetical protein
MSADFDIREIEVEELDAPETDHAAITWITISVKTTTVSVTVTTLANPDDDQTAGQASDGL